MRGAMATATIHEVASKRNGTIYRIRYDYVDAATGKRGYAPGRLAMRARRVERRPTPPSCARDSWRSTRAEHPWLPCDSTLGALLEDWLKLDIQPRLAQTTIAGYEDTVRVHLMPTLGHLPLRKLTPATMQRWETEYRTTHGYRTVQLCHLRLKQACSYGVRMGHMAYNPLADVRPPETQARPRLTWSSEEATAFLKAAETDVYYPLWHFLLGTGARRGEALGLRWSDIDWQAGTATIVQTIRPLRGRTYTKPPKNPQSARVVPLHKGLLKRLQVWRIKQAKHRQRMGDAWTDHGLVFASQVGTPINPNNVTRAFIGLVEQAGISRITVHQLRHTAGTLALAAGATLEEIRQLLGHKKLATTADIYAQVQDAAVRNVVEALRRATGE